MTNTVPPWMPQQPRRPPDPEEYYAPGGSAPPEYDRDIAQYVYQAHPSARQYVANYFHSLQANARRPRRSPTEQLAANQRGWEFGLPPGGPNTLRGRLAGFMGNPVGQAVIGGVMGAASGGVWGLAGGLPGAALGAAIGGTVGAVGAPLANWYREKTVEEMAAQFGRMEAERKFDEENWIGRGLGWLSYPAQWAEQALGTVYQIGGSVTDPAQYGGLSESLGNIRNTWAAGRLAYETDPFTTGQTFVDYDMPETNGGLMALVEARQRIAAGEDPERVHQDIRVRYGAPGELRDLVGQSFLDPTNLVETGGALLARGGARLAGASDLARAAQATPQGGLVKVMQNYRNQLVSERAFRGGFQARRDLNLFQQALVGRTLGELAEGRPYTQPRWWELWKLTPESEARELVFQSSNHVQAALSNLPVDDTYPARAAALLEAYRTADLDNLPAGIDNIATSIEGRVVRRSLPENIGRDHAAAWEATTPDRTNLLRLAEAVGDTPPNVLARIGAGEGDALLRAAGIEDITPAQLEQMRGAFVDDGVPYTPEMARAAIMSGLVEASGKWAAETFGLKSPGFLRKLAGAVKGVESVALLGLNITYPVRNFLNGEATMAARGAWGLRAPGAVMRDLDRMGISPARIRSGLGIADIGDEFGGQSIAAGLKPIQEATRATDQGFTSRLLNTIETKAGDIASKLPPTKIAQDVERWQSVRAMGEGIRQMWSQAWRPGVGFDRLPPQLEQALRAYDARLPGHIYAAIQSGFSPAEIAARVLADAPEIQLASFYDDVARTLGVEPETVSRLMAVEGLGDFLDTELAKLPARPTADDVGRVFRRSRERVERSLTKLASEDAAARLEHAATVAQAEGPAGALRVLDDVEEQLYQTYQNHMQALALEWDEVRRARQFKDTIFARMRERADGTWRRYFDYEDGVYSGVERGIRQGGWKVSDDFLASIRGKRGAIAGFHTRKNTLLDEFFTGKYADDFARDAAWRDTLAKIDSEYTTLIGNVDRLSATADRALTDVFARNLGDAAATRVETWRNAIRRFNREDMQGQQAFRQTLQGLDPAQRNLAWRAFSDQRLQRRRVMLEEALKLQRQVVDERVLQGAQAVPPPPVPYTPVERVPGDPGPASGLNPLGFDAAGRETPYTGPPGLSASEQVRWMVQQDPSFGLPAGVEPPPAVPISATPPRPAPDLAPQSPTDTLFAAANAQGIPTVSASGAPNNRYLLNVLNKYRAQGGEMQLPAAWGQTPAFTADELRAGLAPDRLAEALDALNRRADAQAAEIINRPPVDPELARLEESLANARAEVQRLRPEAKAERDAGSTVGRASQQLADAERRQKALSLQLAQAKKGRIGNAVDDTSKDVPGIDTAPNGFVGLPPGTVDSLTDGGPVPLAQAQEEAWYSYMLPALEEIQKRAEAATGQLPIAGHSQLPPDLQAGIRSYLRDVQGRMPAAKLQAVKWGEFKRDAALLNYSRRFQFNNMLGLVAPYEFWMTNSLIKWALHSLDRPALLANYYRVQKFLNTQVGRPGHPTRLAGRVKIPLPFMPDWMGGGVWINPTQIGLPLDQFFGIPEQIQQATLSRSRGAERKLRELVENGQITQAQADAALAQQGGPVWDRATQLALADDANLKFDAVDMGSLIASPHLPLSWAYNALRGTPERIGPLPLTRQLRNLTAALGMGGPGGVNLEEGLRRKLGLPVFDQWEDYRIDRSLADMAAEGLITAEQAQAAMIERSGPLFEAAEQRSAVQAAGGVGGQIFSNIAGIPVGTLPEGEERQRILALLNSAAYDARENGDTEALERFYDQYPEYSARMALYDDKDERIRSFLVDSVWTAWNGLPDLYRREVSEQFGSEFGDSFLDRDTRDYDSLDPETLAGWARALGRYVPGNVGGEAVPLELAPPEVAARAQEFYARRNALLTPQLRSTQDAYFDIPAEDRVNVAPPDVQAFVDEREARFGQEIFDLQDVYFSLPEGSRARRQYREQNPQLTEYWDWRRQWREANPEAAAYLDSDAPLTRSARSIYLDSHPELAQYWDWRRAWLESNPDIAPYVTEQAQAQPQAAPVQFAPDVQRQVTGYLYANRSLPASVERQLMAQWQQAGQPGRFEEWLMSVMQGGQ